MASNGTFLTFLMSQEESYTYVIILAVVKWALFNTNTTNYVIIYYDMK